MAAALEARHLSKLKHHRTAAAALHGALAESAPRLRTVSPSEWVECEAALEAALYCSTLCSYAQSMALLHAASTAHGWALPLVQITQIWRGGCLIRLGVGVGVRLGLG